MRIEELYGEFTKMCDEQKECSECKYADNFSLCQFSFAYSKGRLDAIDECLHLIENTPWRDIWMLIDTIKELKEQNNADRN